MDIEGENQLQGILFPMSFDEMIDAENTVRAINAIIEKMIDIIRRKSVGVPTKKEVILERETRNVKRQGRILHKSECMQRLSRS